MKNNERYITSTVSAINRIAESGYILKIKYNKEWHPGEVVGIKLNMEDPPRLYSIAGSDKDNEITVLFTEKPDGMLTPKLSEVKKDDIIFISPPFGKFRPSADKAWWICNGTGIAPFRGIWQKTGVEGITLIHGVRKQEEKYFADEIKNLKSTAYVACLSQENNGVDYDGRVTKYIKELESVPEQANYYLCGSAEMSVEVRDILIKKGVPFMNIYTEIYF